MVSSQPAESVLNMFQEQPIPPKLQLKKYEPEPWPFREYACDTPPQTPSVWFSKQFPDQAKIYGCPFMELVQTSGDGFNTVSPVAINTDFFAAILGGDKKLGHKVVYIESECAFYYYEPADHLYKSVSEEKLGNLMRALMIRCAEELGNDVGKWKLFTEFRSDQTIRSIVHRAKSTLAADDSFFGPDSGHQRQQKEADIYERVARAFVEQVLERQAGEVLTLNEAYVHFCQYLKRKNLEPVKRKEFKALVPPVVQQQFDLGLRNDLHDQAKDEWHSGWKGIRALDLEPAGVNS